MAKKWRVKLMKSSRSGKSYQFNIKPYLVRCIPYIEKKLISKQLCCMSANISARAIMNTLSCLGQTLVNRITEERNLGGLLVLPPAQRDSIPFQTCGCPV